MRFGTQLGAAGGSSRTEELARAKAFGSEGVEVGLDVTGLRTGDTTLPELLEQAAAMKADLENASLSAFSLSPGILLKHAQCPDVIRAVGETAKILGARNIRLFFAPHVRWGGPNSTLDEWKSDFDGTHDARYWQATDGANLARMLELSKDYDLRYVFELHHGYTVTSGSAAMRMLEKHPADRVGIIMDPGNMVYEGNEGWRNSVQIMGKYIAYLHCKNAACIRENGRWKHTWAALEDGIANYPEIVTALKDIDFHGYLCIEDLRRDVAPKEKIAAGIAYLKSLIESPIRVMPA